eukprot:m.143540 g.143540  ORF g.143540 m.143540 type:complete len:73 (+) comp13207_c0_seq10:633-851(+)
MRRWHRFYWRLKMMTRTTPCKAFQVQRCCECSESIDETKELEDQRKRIDKLLTSILKNKREKTAKNDAKPHQ